jgi:hypothetical protein
MTTLSDKDIKRELGENLLIYPFKEDNLKGASPDYRRIKNEREKQAHELNLRLKSKNKNQLSISLYGFIGINITPYQRQFFYQY